MKFIYLFLYLTRKQIQSCEDICEVCSLSSIIFTKYLIYRSICTGSINSTYLPEILSCSYCLDYNSLKRKSCLSDELVLNSCTNSQICGNSYFDSEKGSFKLEKPTKSTICKWNIDLRNRRKNINKVEIEFGNGQTGALVIFSYLMARNLDNDERNERITEVVNITEGSMNKEIELDDCNYIVVMYSTPNFDIRYSPITLKWNDQSSSQDLTTILLSVYLSMSALSCIILFCICYRCRSRSRIQRLQNSRTRTQSRLSVSQPPINQETTIVSERAIEQLYPKALFQYEMLELGDSICCICFEK